MGDRRQRKATQRRGVRQDFYQQSYSTSYSASQLISLGYNRYDAWMMTLGLSPLTIVKRMDLSAHVKRLHWPDAVPRPNAIQYLEKIRAGRTGYLGASELRPNEDFVTRFCKAIDQTPDVLVAPGQREPAPPEIVEAAMKRVERYAFDGENVPTGLWSFVVNEVQKGEGLGNQCWGNGIESKFYEIMDCMESVYNDLHLQPNLTRDGELYAYEASVSRPVTIASLRSKYQDVVSYHADDLLSKVQTGEMKRAGLDAYLAWRSSPQVREFLQGRANMVYLRTQLETVGYGDLLPYFSMRMQP